MTRSANTQKRNIQSKIRLVSKIYLIIIFLAEIQYSEGAGGGGVTTCPCPVATVTYRSSTTTYQSCQNDCDPGCYRVTSGFFYDIDNGYNHGYDQCLTCMTGCLACTDGVSCADCAPGYYLDFMSACISCSLHANCATCDDTSCHTCQSGFFMDYTLSPALCVVCMISNCQTCADGVICSVCDSGYVVDTAASSTNCIACSTLTNCLVCSDGPLCDTCVSGYFFSRSSLSCQLCSDHIANCDTCSDPFACDSCSPGYMTDSSSSVTLCVSQCTLIPQCLTCLAGPVCTSCSTGWALDLTDSMQSCVQCNVIPNCVSCSDGPVCNGCSSNFLLDISNPTPQCVSCETVLSQCSTCTDGTTPVCNSCFSGFSRDMSTANKMCVTCSLPNCQGCIDGPVCSVCQSGFVLDLVASPNVCVSCSIPNCLSCINGPKCTKCQVNLIPDSSGFSCVSCPSNYYSRGTQCYLCSNGCLDCALQTDGITFICSSCINGYFLQSGKCLRCALAINQCSQCSSSTVCQSCSLPYAITSTTNLCTSCVSSYFYINNVCTQNPGCLSQHNNKCLACLRQYFFTYVPSNASCSCDKGRQMFKVNDNLVECSSKCGNGVWTAPEEQCDDGNLRNGDGCSDVCTWESGFTCSMTSPSVCRLSFNFVKLIHNYVMKYDNKNRCKFSFSVLPYHQSLNYFNFINHIALNTTSQFIILKSITISYQKETNEIIIEADYLKTLQKNVLRATLLFSKTIPPITSRLLQEKGFSSNELNEIRKISSEKLFAGEGTYANVGTSSNSSSSLIEIDSVPDELSVDFEIKGIGEPVVYFEEYYQKMYEATSYVALAIAVIALIQFIVASYVHKMIGLETIQVLQLFYFIRMILTTQSNTFLTSINILKYVAYCGYSISQLINPYSLSQTQLLISPTLPQEFHSVDLQRFFILNVNVSLTVPLIVIGFYVVRLVKKYGQRNKYLKKFEQLEKDKFTIVRRKCEWVYEHGVFPFVMVFIMIVVFGTIIQFQTVTQDIQSSASQKTFIFANYFIHITLLFLILCIFCHQIFNSYHQYITYCLSASQLPPPSLIQKLQHDKNNPDRPNYKPGYVLFYLVFYLTLLILLTLNVIFERESLKDLTVYLMIVINVACFFVVLKWKPYIETIRIHMIGLKLNHLTNLLVVCVCQFLNKVEVNLILQIIIVYLIIILLIAVVIIGLIRIYAQAQFRKLLHYHPDLLKFDQSQIQNKKSFLSKQQQSLNEAIKYLRNPYMFQTQLLQACQRYQIKHQNANYLTEQQAEIVKKRLRIQIFSQNPLIEHLNIPYSIDDNNQKNLIDQLIKLNLQNGKKGCAKSTLSKSLMQKNSQSKG